MKEQGAAVVADMIEILKKEVAWVGKIIVRRVRVDRTRTPQAMLDALGWKQYVDKRVLATMPRGVGEEVEMIYFGRNLRGGISEGELATGYRLRRMKPDPYAQIADNMANSTFVKENHNVVQWPISGGKFASAEFKHLDGVNYVQVGISGIGWDSGWSMQPLFGGVNE